MTSRRRLVSLFVVPQLLSIVLLFSSFADSYVTARYLHDRLSAVGHGSFLTTDEFWFNQILDHFSPTDHRRFGQRYYQYFDDFQLPDGPIFLKICGEATCPGISNDYLSVLAKKFGAGIVSLEHRYYGKSSPFKSLTTENLKYLSSKQALFDLAAFRQFYQDTLNSKHNRTDSTNPCSAVVQAVYNFTEFDEQIGVSAGVECKATLQEITELVEEHLTSNGKALKALFGASELEIDGDFLYFLADAAVTAFQYGNPDKLCLPIIEAKKAGDDLVLAYAKYVKDYYIGSVGVSVQTYNQNHLKETALSEDSGDRLWWFQVCTEVAYFQVAPSNDSIRSSKLDTRYHLDLCENVFGRGIYPDVDATNLYYGGKKIAGSKIIFTNGSQDPWRHASKQLSSPEMPSYLISCHNCGHGTDLRGCPQSPLSPEGDAQNCSSPDAVHKVRQQIIESIDLWLSECQNDERAFI
ncbi:hypothetical protein MLD38_028662 [Melastoma candidum]|uniref:Uncharacterized protein n=1 Tax=Melastoma candidum TaxID=119954 RepID=A0ACB9N1Q8_9MYRT|nr:hypothetical protein MLD38_028662 [Melastoma candidum]